MKITYGANTTKKGCPLLFIRNANHIADCLQVSCGIWDNKRGCCGLKHPPLPKCIAMVPK